jgi:hypothetical protein
VPNTLRKLLETTFRENCPISGKATQTEVCRKCTLGAKNIVSIILGRLCGSGHNVGFKKRVFGSITCFMQEKVSTKTCSLTRPIESYRRQGANSSEVESNLYCWAGCDCFRYARKMRTASCQGGVILFDPCLERIRRKIQCLSSQSSDPVARFSKFIGCSSVRRVIN